MVDFLQPYFEAGLQILTSAGGTASWATPAQMLRALVNLPEFWRIIAVLAVLIVIMGHVFWLGDGRVR